jgi:hypothetical protein
MFIQISDDKLKKQLLNAYRRGMIDGTEALVMAIKDSKDDLASQPFNEIVDLLVNSLEDTRERLTKDMDEPGSTPSIGYILRRIEGRNDKDQDVPISKEEL